MRRADLIEVGLPYSESPRRQEPLSSEPTTRARFGSGRPLRAPSSLSPGNRPSPPHPSRSCRCAYANQIIGGGDGRAVAARLADAGASGVIVADLTPDEGMGFESSASREVGLAGRVPDRPDHHAGAPCRGRPPVGRVPLLRCHSSASRAPAPRCRRRQRLVGRGPGRLTRARRCGIWCE